MKEQNLNSTPNDLFVCAHIIFYSYWLCLKIGSVMSPSVGCGNILIV